MRLAPLFFFSASLAAAWLRGEEVSTQDIIGDAWKDSRNPIVTIFGGKRLDLWSLQPISPPPQPTVKNQAWVRNGIDSFVLSAMEQESRTPAPGSAKRALARRLFFDLTGLPPAPEELDTYLGDTSTTAYERLVDHLLAKPEYGEHWARMWLDVVRYSDSNGFDWDEFRPNAWRFRDYIIRSFNADKPFHQLIREHLAGDEMFDGPPKSPEEQDALIATGFLRLGPHDNSAAQFGEGPRVRAALMNDLVETTGSAFLGLTLNCARCHDHKKDPISQADYYRMQAFFAGVKFHDELPLDLAPEQDIIRQHNATVDQKISVHQKVLDGVNAQVTKRLGKKKPSKAEITGALTKEESSEVEANEKAIDVLKKQRRVFTTGLLMADENASPPTTHVLYQGVLTDQREEVMPGTFSILNPNPTSVAAPVRKDSSGRRTALAAWIVSPENPLTARVIVNRIWQSHFGEGLQPTAQDFGFAGATPKNPGLLDWLAKEFIKSGWSIKHLHRLIVTSTTYRQSFGGGQGNKPRRLSAEALRDSMLAVSGRLIPSQGGPPIWPELPDEILQANPAFLDDNAQKTKGWYPSPKEKQGVRSIYLVQKRSLRVPMMEIFDLPENSLSCAQRTISTVAPQALNLLNSEFSNDIAKSFASRVAKEAGDEPRAQIALAFKLALQREPSEFELSRCLKFLSTQSLVELCRSLMNLNECGERRTIDRCPRREREAGRLGAQLRREVGPGRVQVHADADDHEAHAVGFGLQLGEDARDLATVEQDVVRPLDARLERAAVADRLRDGEARHERQARHLERRDARLQNDGRVEVHARRRGPRATEAAASRSLLLRDDGRAFRCAAARELRGEPVGRVDGRAVHDLAAQQPRLDVLADRVGQQQVAVAHQPVAASGDRFDAVALLAQLLDPLPDRGPRHAETLRDLRAGLPAASLERGQQIVGLLPHRAAPAASVSASPRAACAATPCCVRARRARGRSPAPSA